MSGHSKWNNIKRKKEKTVRRRVRFLPRSVVRWQLLSAKAVRTP